MKSVSLRPILVLGLVGINTPQLLAAPIVTAGYSLGIDGIDPVDINNNVHIGEAPPIMTDAHIVDVGNTRSGHYTSKLPVAIGGLNVGEAQAHASAAIGHLHAEARAIAVADNNLAVTARAFATSIDDTPIFTPPLPFPNLFGRPVTFMANVQLTGQLLATATGTADVRGFSEVTAEIFVKQGGIQKGFTRVAGSRSQRAGAAGNGGTHTPPPTSAQFEVRNMIIGQRFELTIFLTAHATMQINDSIPQNDLDGRGSASSEYFHTLLWGGVSSAFLSDSGQPMPDGYSIPSESGFDYSQPFVVPEPANLVSFFVAYCTWLSRTRPRRRGVAT
jgi:hypothetical protein